MTITVVITVSLGWVTDDLLSSNQRCTSIKTVGLCPGLASAVRKDLPGDKRRESSTLAITLTLTPNPILTCHVMEETLIFNPNPNHNPNSNPNPDPNPDPNPNPNPITNPIPNLTLI